MRRDASFSLDVARVRVCFCNRASRPEKLYVVWTQRLDVAAEASATVVEVDDGSSGGVFAAVSGPRVHGTHGARKCAHLRPRICMQLPA